MSFLGVIQKSMCLQELAVSERFATVNFCGNATWLVAVLLSV